jgi:acetoin utilization protein AcuB
MRVFEIMSKTVRTVTPTTAAHDALTLMRTERLHHLVVVRQSRIAGVLSDRDFLTPGRFDVRSPATVSDVMTTDVVTIDQNDSVRDAANLMRGHGIHCLPVTSRGRLVGILTTSDLLQLLGKGVDRPARKARPTLSHRVPHRKAHMPAGRW